MVHDFVRAAGGNLAHQSSNARSGGRADYYGHGGAHIGAASGSRRMDNTKTKVKEALLEGHKLTTTGQTTILVVITTTPAISHLLQTSKSSYQTRMLDFAYHGAGFIKELVASQRALASAKPVARLKNPATPQTRPQCNPLTQPLASYYSSSTIRD